MMADFCQECSIKIFDEDFGDLKALPGTEKGGEVSALCEGCGFIVVDGDGKRVAQFDEDYWREK